MLLYQILEYTIHREMQKSHTKTMNIKYRLQCGTKKFNYLMGHILYKIFKIILNISSKNIKE